MTYATNKDKNTWCIYTAHNQSSHKYAIMRPSPSVWDLNRSLFSKLESYVDKKILSIYKKQVIIHGFLAESQVLKAYCHIFGGLDIFGSTYP